MLSKCGHCGGFGTRVQTIEPDGASYKQIAVCCSACNAILGVIGYLDPGALLKAQEAKINALASTVTSLGYELENIKRTLQQIAQQTR